MKKIFILSIFAITIACQSKTEQTTKDSTATPTDTVATATNDAGIDESMCFLAAEGKDTTTVKLYFDGENVTGDMQWLPYEKDGAVGTLQGKIKDGIITADYDYVIEGSQQVEEKVFVLNGNTLEEKSGELIDKNGKLVIKDMSKIQTITVLKKIDCKN